MELRVYIGKAFEVKSTGAAFDVPISSAISIAPVLYAEYLDGYRTVQKEEYSIVTDPQPEFRTRRT